MNMSMYMKTALKLLCDKYTNVNITCIGIWTTVTIWSEEMMWEGFQCRETHTRACSVTMAGSRQVTIESSALDCRKRSVIWWAFEKYILCVKNSAKWQPLLSVRASLVAQLVKSPPAMRETWVRSLGWEDPWRRERLPTPVFWPGEFHGLYSPRGSEELDMTEWHSLSLLSVKLSTEEWAHRIS